MDLKKIMILIVALLPLAAGAKKGETPDTISARRAFIEMPSSVLELVSKDTRLDMLDYFDAGSPYVAVNELHGNSQLKALTPDYAEIEVTPVSRLQIKVLPLKKGNQIVMAVYTTGDSIGTRDSDIYFFDASMNPLPNEKFLKQPKLADFFGSRNYKNNAREIKNGIPYYGVEYRLDPATTTLSAGITLDEIVSEEARKVLQPLLKPGIDYIWTGSRFTLNQ